MNITELFQLQNDLDEYIMKDRHRDSRTPTRKALALLVEIGELANEARSFKYWSEDRNPRTKKALEEFADCLHFTISIGIERGIQPQKAQLFFEKNSRAMITAAISAANLSEDDQKDALDDLLISLFDSSVKMRGFTNQEDETWLHLFNHLLLLGLVLGFDFEQMEDAYKQKNAKNIQRQKENY